MNQIRGKLKHLKKKVKKKSENKKMESNINNLKELYKEIDVKSVQPVETMSGSCNSHQMSSRSTKFKALGNILTVFLQYKYRVFQINNK